MIEATYVPGVPNVTDSISVSLSARDAGLLVAQLDIAIARARAEVPVERYNEMLALHEELIDALVSAHDAVQPPPHRW